ncbi:hypothetical protein [Candidatus Pyrohabitans sp.]
MRSSWLKLGIPALLAVLMLGSVLAASSDNANEIAKDKVKNKDISEGQITKRVHSNSPIDKKAEEEAEVTASSLSTENLQYIRTDTLEVHLDKADAYAYFKLYKEDVPDNDYDYYIVWMQATGYNKQDVCLFGTDDSNLYEVKTGVNLNTGVVTDWEPISDINTNDPKQVTVSLQVQHNGVSAGISETFTLNKDHVGPVYGDSDEFWAHWDGNYEGSQGERSGLEFRVPKGAGWDYEYTLYLSAGCA